MSSRIAARIFDALRGARPAAELAERDPANDPRIDLDFVTGTPTRAGELDQAQCDASLVPEPQDSGEPHVLVSF